MAKPDANKAAATTSTFQVRQPVATRFTNIRLDQGACISADPNDEGIKRMLANSVIMAYEPSDREIVIDYAQDFIKKFEDRDNSERRSNPNSPHAKAERAAKAREKANALYDEELKRLEDEAAEAASK